MGKKQYYQCVTAHLLPLQMELQIPHYILRKPMLFILFWISALSSSYALYDPIPSVTSLPERFQTIMPLTRKYFQKWRQNYM